ncbi:MAG: GNAT family N-acetyltransferase [Gemmataceae bacterium]
MARSLWKVMVGMRVQEPSAKPLWTIQELTTLGPALDSARRLYESTLDADERIPWQWIERSIAAGTKPGATWQKHLIVAVADDDPDHVVAYIYGAFLPGYGGYVCYLGVAPDYRRQGLSAPLFEAMTGAFRADAAQMAEPLPFVVWESYRPQEQPELWEARVRSFARAGGRWVQGLTLQSPNYEDAEGDPVPLQVFVRPEEEPADSFGPERLRELVAQLLIRVYKEKPGDRLYESTLLPGIQPRLAPAVRALPREVVSHR